jgi:cytochrome c oxidase assembly factor CtaG
MPFTVSDLLTSGWDVHPSLLLAIGLLVALYVGGVVAIGRRLRRAPTGWQMASFAAGTAVLLLALQSPLHHLADAYLFSVHMAQHELITLVAPPLLLLGTPDWLVRGLARRLPFQAALHTAAYPIVAFALFNLLFTLAHAPAIYDGLFGNEVLHRATHILFVLAATITWLPILSPVPDVIPRISQPAQMLYCFLQTIPGSLVGSLLTLADWVLYRHYGTKPLELGVSPVADQQLGGLLMWVVAGTFFLVILTTIFFVWADREEATAFG